MIPVFRPCIGQEELDAVKRVFESGWIGQGPECAKLEEEFGTYLGEKRCLAVNSCTSALHLAIKCLNIGKGDEVIVPTMTFVSTAAAVMYCGATPVFADVGEDMQISPEDVKRKITKKTKAIIIVHYGGASALKRDLIDLGLPLIEDCAHAAGSKHGNKYLGTFGIISCFSFHAVKNMTCGDGGMFVTKSQKIYDRAKNLRWMGIDKDTWARTTNKYKWQYNIPELGFKYNMNDIQAAIARVQLKKLEGMNHERRLICLEYGFSRYILGNSCHIAWGCFKKRDALAKHLGAKGISTSVHYAPLHKYKVFGRKDKCPVADHVYKEILSLPCYPDLKSKEQEYIIKEIKDFYDKKTK